MAYADQSRRPSPASLAGTIGVHIALGTALILGMTVSGVLPEPDEDFVGINLDPPKPPPPPTPEPQVEPKDPVAAPQTPPTFVPEPPIDFEMPVPSFETTPILPPPGPIVPKPNVGNGTSAKIPSTPKVPPVAASPRNDPGRWITDRDYRSLWIRKGMTGLARFRLDIAADGSVTDCVITGSTGHGELDAATCRLLQKRARFQPARNGNGDAIAGSYASSVSWQVPE